MLESQGKPDLRVNGPGEPDEAGPQLLFTLQPWWRAFGSNLRELVLPAGGRGGRRRGLDALKTGDWFWREVLVRQPLPKRALLDSYLAHIFVVVAVIGLTQAGWFDTPPVQRRDPFENVHIEYYNVSEYLPEIDTGKPAARPAHDKPKAVADIPHPADPGYAKQEIISVPPNPDNNSQTIVTPQLPKVSRQVDLPNIDLPNMVSHLPALAPQPIIVPKSVAIQRSGDEAAPKIDAKSPALKLDARAQIPKLQFEVATKSAALVDSLAIPALPANDNPALETPSPQTIVPPPSKKRGGQGTAQESASAAISGVTSNHAAQIIALSTRPVDPHGLLEVPKGNRLGSFEAGPSGRMGGSGTPASAPTGGGRGNGSGDNAALPPGIKVGPSPGTTPASGTVVASPSAGRPPTADTATREKFMAALRSPVATPPRTSVAPPTSRDESIEDKRATDSFFGSKRFYTLTFNAPNLNSATGSWIIHFAELKPMGQNGDLSGPSPLSKADPAYPPQLMHDRVEGTVVLYAVVHADGSISDVRVLNSVHEELDANAMKALRRWTFRPGTKNGNPVDVEMTVRIPFKAKKMMF